MLIVLSAMVQAQETSTNWGNKILLGTRFTATDSLRLVSSSVTDSVMADTLFSGALLIKDTGTGINAFVAYLENVAGGSDSVKVQFRYVDMIRWVDDNGRQSTVKYGEWHDIFSFLTTSTENDTTLSPGTSSFWRPRTARQFRVLDTSVTTDTSIITLVDYLK